MSILNKNVELLKLLDELVQLKYDLEKSANNRKAFYIDVSNVDYQSDELVSLMKKAASMYGQESKKEKVVQIKFFSDITDINIFLKDNPSVEYIDFKVLDYNTKYLIYKI